MVEYFIGIKFSLLFSLYKIGTYIPTPGTYSTVKVPILVGVGTYIPTVGTYSTVKVPLLVGSRLGREAKTACFSLYKICSRPDKTIFNI